MGLLDDVDDVGAPDGAVAQKEGDHDDKGGEGQGQEVGLGVKAQGHLVGVHHAQAEELPQQPGQRCPQNRAQGAGAHGNDPQLPEQLPLDLLPGGPQGQEDAVLLGLLPQEEGGGVGGEHGTADHRQDENHHHLLAAVAPFGQYGQNGGGAHHTHVGGNQ